MAVDRAIYVSVAGDAVNHHLAQTLSKLVGDAWQRFVSVPAVCGLRNDYANPGQLGADRLAAALGAWQRGQSDCLVVNCGTATTIDVVRRGDDMLTRLPLSPSQAARPDLQKKLGNATLEAQAHFVGGVILPGLSLMKSSLFRNTARLPDAAGKVVPIPDNTDDAIETGCLLAQLGAIEAMRRNLPAKAPLVLSGGAAKNLQPYLLDCGFTVVDAPELVLEGLAVAILHRFP